MKTHTLTALSACCLLLLGALAPANAVQDKGPEAAAAAGLLLDDFADSQAATKRWTTVNDGVMGGKSKGAPSFEDGRLTFAGTLNTNGGGFSSIRSKPSEHDLTGTAGLLLRIKGDGRTYQASLRTDAKLGRWWIPFRAEFETTQDEWIEVFVPYETMTPTIMGQVIEKNPPKLELDKVQSFGIMLADGKDGDFTLQIDWIKAVEQAPADEE